MCKTGIIPAFVAGISDGVAERPSPGSQLPATPTAQRGELLGLKWGDIDYKNLTITIRRQILWLNGVVQEAPLKTKNSYRPISISQDLADILKAKQMKENGPTEYVFSSPNGVDIKTVFQMLGHYSAGFTLDTYAHVTTAMQKEAAATVGSFLQNKI